MVHHVKGDLLDTKCQLICHQVNCQGKMNSGVAKAVREKYPHVFDEYLKVYNPTLGTNLIVSAGNNTQYIVNMYAQNEYGYDGARYTSYDAFWECLNGIKNWCGDTVKTIAFPKGIGSVRGGASWDVVLKMIEVVLADQEVYIYELC